MYLVRRSSSTRMIHENETKHRPHRIVSKAELIKKITVNERMNERMSQRQPITMLAFDSGFIVIFSQFTLVNQQIYIYECVIPITWVDTIDSKVLNIHLFFSHLKVWFHATFLSILVDCTCIQIPKIKKLSLSDSKRYAPCLK